MRYKFAVFFQEYLILAVLTSTVNRSIPSFQITYRLLCSTHLQPAYPPLPVLPAFLKILQVVCSSNLAIQRNKQNFLLRTGRHVLRPCSLSICFGMVTDAAPDILELYKKHRFRQDHTRSYSLTMIFQGSPVGIP